MSDFMAAVPQLEAANGQLEAAKAQQQEADALRAQLQTAQVRCSMWLSATAQFST